MAFILSIVVATLLTILTPGLASAAPDCDPSRFSGPDGLDLTGYLQCTNPTVSDATVVPGGSIEFSGGGFKSNSSIDIFLVPADQGGGQAAGTLESDGGSTDIMLISSQAQASPALALGSVETDGSGNFSTVVTIPESVAPGPYLLEARGVDPDGNPLTVSLSISVVAAGSASPVTPSSGSLPYTGSSAGRWVTLGLALLGLGAVAVWGARRERRGPVASSPGE